MAVSTEVVLMTKFLPSCLAWFGHEVASFYRQFFDDKNFRKQEDHHFEPRSYVSLMTDRPN